MSGELTEAERLIVGRAHDAGTWNDVLAGIELIVTERVAAARREVIAAVEATYPPYNYELRYDGTEDPIGAAYVEGFREVDSALDRFRPEGGRDIFYLYQPPADAAAEAIEGKVADALRAVRDAPTTEDPS